MLQRGDRISEDKLMKGNIAKLERRGGVLVIAPKGSNHWSIHCTHIY